MRMRKLKLALTLATLVAGTTIVWGYAFLTPSIKWPDGQIVMQEQLGPGSGTLIDGATSWNQVFESGLAIWNQQITRVQFAAVRDSTADIANGNRINNVIFGSDVFGKPFGGNTLAITLSLYIVSSGTLVEADIVFNTKFTFNSYRGNLRTGIEDLRRVGIHESGHVLGLDHPDDYGQSVTAIMNAHASNVDTVTADDIAGVQALYPTPGGPVNNGTVAFPPRNESLDFRNQLEAKYRDGLRRGPQSTFVDNEGDVIWISEYQRYRVNLCNNTVAIANVFTAIDGKPAPSVCGNAPAGTVNFPPRNESLDFKKALEAKYQNDLHRSAGSSTVDGEGDVVWIQEYLRYRVNGCSHGDAVAKVLSQIDTGVIAPVCR